MVYDAAHQGLHGIIIARKQSPVHPFPFLRSDRPVFFGGIKYLPPKLHIIRFSKRFLGIDGQEYIGSLFIHGYIKAGESFLVVMDLERGNNLGIPKDDFLFLLADLSKEMDEEAFLKLLETASTLSNEQATLLKTALEDRVQHGGIQQSTLMSRIEHNFANNPLCPHCQSKSVKRWGHQNGRQRYYCNQCHKTFNAFTGTPLCRLRVVDALDRYVDCMTSSMTLRPAAQKCNVSLSMTSISR